MAEATQTTEDLIDRVGLGDELARIELLERYRDSLRRMVAARLDRRLAPRVDPSDIVQETLADASRRMDVYLADRPIPFVAWLRQLAEDRVIDAHRRHVLSQKRSVTREGPSESRAADGSSLALAGRLIADDTSPSNRLIREERREQMMAALEALPLKDREVLVMRHLEQLGTGEIAEALGITTGAVEARLLRALIRLRSRLEPAP